VPTATAFSGGVGNGNSVAFRIPLPAIELQGVLIVAIGVLRGGGRLLTDGDTAMVGLSHQTDLLTGDLLDDQDDFNQAMYRLSRCIGCRQRLGNRSDLT